ncbi:MAG: hypothetical protein J3R72DRAFT_75326 [Linnemannia gamsii]|nr:MAG: hypothetical protein J3R72DRAFT_75326 [Linnemannia gamsii]
MAVVSKLSSSPTLSPSWISYTPINSTPQPTPMSAYNDMPDDWSNWNPTPAPAHRTPQRNYEGWPPTRDNTPETMAWIFDYVDLYTERIQRINRILRSLVFQTILVLFLGVACFYWPKQVLAGLYSFSLWAMDTILSLIGTLLYYLLYAIGVGLLICIRVYYDVSQPSFRGFDHYH